MQYTADTTRFVNASKPCAKNKSHYNKNKPISWMIRERLEAVLTFPFSYASKLGSVKLQRICKTGVEELKRGLTNRHQDLKESRLFASTENCTAKNTPITAATTFMSNHMSSGGLLQVTSTLTACTDNAESLKGRISDVNTKT